jgi:hypothetical protein
MKQKRYSDKQRNQAHPVLSAGSRQLAVRQEPPPRRAVAQRDTDGAVETPRRPATAVSAAAVARAVQTSPAYFSHALSRWSAIWGGSFYDLIAVAERFRSIPSLAALEVSISQQLKLDTAEASGGLEGPQNHAASTDPGWGRASSPRRRQRGGTGESSRDPQEFV